MKKLKLREVKQSVTITRIPEAGTFSVLTLGDTTSSWPPKVSP